jgi:hypothetical protein
MTYNILIYYMPVLSNTEIRTILDTIQLPNIDAHTQARCDILANRLPASVLQKIEEMGIEVGEYLPFTCIRGDFERHVDKTYDGDQFEQTTVIYLTDNCGTFYVGENPYSISAGEAITFGSGVEHYTENTGDDMRVIIGPLNERGERVGVAVTAFINDISPTSGPVGTFITITGGEFNSVDGITIGGIDAVGFTVVDNNTVELYIPEGVDPGIPDMYLMYQGSQINDEPYNLFTVEEDIVEVTTTRSMTRMFTDIQSNARLRGRGLGSGTVPTYKTTTRPNGTTPKWAAAPLIRTQNRNPSVQNTGKLAMRDKGLGGNPQYH